MSVFCNNAVNDMEEKYYDAISRNEGFIGENS